MNTVPLKLMGKLTVSESSLRSLIKFYRSIKTIFSNAIFNALRLTFFNFIIKTGRKTFLQVDEQNG